jgi:hypothetical protein
MQYVYLLSNFVDISSYTIEVFDLIEFIMRIISFAVVSIMYISQVVFFKVWVPWWGRELHTAVH